MDKEERKALRAPDLFVIKGQAILRFLWDRRRRFVPVAIGGGVFLLGVALYDWWADSRTETAWNAYSVALVKPEPERWEALKSVHDQFGNNRATYLIAVALGDHFFDMAKKASLKEEADPSSAAQSAEWYGKALRFRKLLPKERQLIAVNRAGAIEMQKKWDDALAEFQTAASMAPEYRSLALLGSARIFELKKEKGKAVEAYQTIVKDEPESEVGRLAKTYLWKLESPWFQ